LIVKKCGKMNLLFKEVEMDFNIFDPESNIYKIAEWLTKLVLANFFWVIFTLLGLGVFGIMPATAALFGIMNKWLSGEENIKIFREYWNLYRKFFVRANIIGLIIILIAVILYIDLDYFKTREGWYNILIKNFIYILIILYFLNLIYLFPLLVKYDIKIRYIIKNALIYIFLTPLEVFQIILGLVILAVVFYFLPSLLPFLAVSLPVYWIARISRKGISKVESKVIESMEKE
ncbi:MAG TPA: DUF624 domain-containing protein, partial [Halanaerobiales bacterium]|nr:DUF624 domain-containing protein [Halanaerobiales bacterium]